MFLSRQSMGVRVVTVPSALRCEGMEKAIGYLNPKCQIYLQTLSFLFLNCGSTSTLPLP